MKDTNQLSLFSSVTGEPRQIGKEQVRQPHEQRLANVYAETSPSPLAHPSNRLLIQRKGSLAAEHRSWGIPDDDLIAWLLDHGVSESAMLLPWPLSGGHARFEGKYFAIDTRGDPIITFRAQNRGEIIDLVAWAPTSGKCASWHGAAFCLGDSDSVFNPATFFMGAALRVHRTPLEWLRAERDGIVIVQPRLAYAYLRNVPRLSFSDPLHAQRVNRWLQPPKPKTEILIEVPRGREAA